jgi:hypothetical protein
VVLVPSTAVLDTEMGTTGAAGDVGGGVEEDSEAPLCQQHPPERPVALPLCIGRTGQVGRASGRR